MDHFKQARTFSLSLLLLLTLLCSGCASSNPSAVKHITPTATATDTPLPSSTPLSLPAFPNASQIDAYLSERSKSGVLNGTVLIAHNGMLFSKGYGFANRNAQIANTPSTMFRIGSVTKQFTAMAILILQDQGKLHTTDHLCLYIPACPQDWQAITIEQLLTHSSGIPDYTNFPDFVPSWTQATTTEELVSRFKAMPLDFTPGSTFRYSNSGYVLLGFLIERIAKQSYASFLQQTIFNPLHMISSGYDMKYAPLPLHATGYYPGYSRPQAYDPSVFDAAGALYSSSEDLYRWDEALTTTQLVSQQALNEMFTLHIHCPAPGSAGGCVRANDQGYGYAWFIAKEPLGQLVYHIGRVDGFLSYNGFYPQHNLMVVVLSNLETTDVGGIADDLVHLVA